jgi:DICT domain-containing protein
VELQEKKMSVIYSLLEIKDENVVLFDSIEQTLAYVREQYSNMFVFYDNAYREPTAFRLNDSLNVRPEGIFVFEEFDITKTATLKIQKHEGVYRG